LFGLLILHSFLSCNTSNNSNPSITAIQKEKHLSSIQETPSENVNMVNYEISSKTISYEAFDENNYQCRSKEQISESSIDNFNIERKVHGSDGRTIVENPKEHPYLPCAKIRIFYDGIYDPTTKTNITLVFGGTAFLEGPNLAVSAGHCVYQDVTTDEYDDKKDNPRFPDRIEFYFGCESVSDIQKGSNYEYYAEAKTVNIEYEYYSNREKSVHDWTAISLDRDIGNATGWYGKISNFTTNSYSIYTWGYPGDKKYGTLWESQGTITGNTKYEYHHNMDTYSGQSGSPIFMDTSEGYTYVCGIHTSGESSYNSGTIINSLIFSYLNSFVSSEKTSDNYQYLDLSIDSKSGSVWSIKITNETSHIRKITYNEKMCFDDDAKNWSKLNDTISITMNPYSSVIVSVSENWFATTIVVSYEYNNIKVISYANNLDNKKKTLSQYTSLI
jgi:V8-like Glu-specific endopeptidase